MKNLITASKRGLIISLCIFLIVAFSIQPMGVSAEDGSEQIEGPKLASITYDPVQRLKFANDSTFLSVVDGDKITLNYDDDSSEIYVYSDENNSSFIQQGGDKVIPMWFSEGAAEGESGYVGYDTETKSIFFEYKGIKAYSPQEKNYLVKSIYFEQDAPKTLVQHEDSETRTDDNDEEYEYYPLEKYDLFQMWDCIVVTYENPLGKTLQADYYYTGDRFQIEDDTYPGAYSNYISPEDLDLIMPDQAVSHLEADNEYAFDISWCERASSDYDYPTFSTNDKPYALVIKAGGGSTDPTGAVEITSFDFDRTNKSELVFSFNTKVTGNPDYMYTLLECDNNGEIYEETWDELEENEVYCWIGNIVKDKDIQHGTDNSITVNFTLKALDSKENVIATSGSIPVTIDISSITKGRTSLPEIPDIITMGNSGYINADIRTFYEFKWSVEGSAKNNFSMDVVSGKVSSVTSSNTKVLKVERKSSFEEEYYNLKPLKTGTSTLTVKYVLEGNEKTISKKVKVNDSYLQFECSQNTKVYYVDLPAGCSTSFNLKALLFTYDYESKKYVLSGDITDYVTFKADMIVMKETGREITNDVTASVKGNVVTVSAPKKAPEGMYYIRVMGSYDNTSSTVDLISINIGQKINRILVNDDFYCPRKDMSSVFDPSFVYYSKGVENTLKISKIKLSFSGVTVKDKSGESLKTGSKIKKSQLPLTLTGTGNTARFSAWALDADGNSLAYVSFDNYTVSELEIKLSSKSMAYTGEALKPTVTLKYAGKTISKSGYKITYLNNKNVGTATIKIEDKNNEYNCKYVTFKIKPKKPTIKTPEAGSKALTAKWAAMKTKMSTARITGYQIQVATNKAFTKNKKSKKIAGYSNTSYKFTSLKAHTTYYVRVRTYKKIGRTVYYSAWSAVKNIKTE